MGADRFDRTLDSIDRRLAEVGKLLRNARRRMARQRKVTDRKFKAPADAQQRSEKRFQAWRDSRCEGGK